jgi:centromere protein I
MADKGEIQMEPQEALQYLTGGGDFYQFKTKLAVQSLGVYAKDVGLSPKEITSLVAIAGSGRLGVQSAQKLIRCLIPQEHVEQEAAVKVLSCLGVPNIAASVKALLLKWTVLVFDLLDGDHLLSCLYDVLFHFLDYDSLRPTVCQLLCYITRREHVMEFRIHKLLSLLKSVGVNDQPIVSLLWAFRVYRPDLLSLSMKSGRMALFKSVDRSLAADIKRVQV